MMLRAPHPSFRSKRIAGAALALAMMTGLAAQGTAAFAEAPVNPELAAARRAYEASEYMDAMRLARHQAQVEVDHRRDLAGPRVIRDRQVAAFEDRLLVSHAGSSPAGRRPSG